MKPIARMFERVTTSPLKDAGSTHINGPAVQDEAQIPFGGMKASGYGRFGSRVGIREFTELRWITIETKPTIIHSDFAVSGECE
jgi:acyl-CoA reductase-like NAD-dependent aldehyde dehydrogenase